MRLGFHSFILYGIFAVINPHLSVLLHTKGYSSSVIGILMGIFYLSGAVGPLIAMALLKHTNYNYRFFLCILPLIAAVLVFFVGVMSWIWGVALIMWCLGGVVSSFVPVSDMVNMHLLENPHRKYGIIRGMGSTGYIFIASIIAIFPIIDLDSTHSLFLIMVISFSYAALFSILIPRTKKQGNEYNGTASSNNKSMIQTFREFPRFYKILLVIYMFNFMGISSLSVYLPLYAKLTFNFTNITSIWIIAAASEVVGLLFGQRIISRIGYHASCIIVLSGTAIRLVLLGLIHHSIIIYLTQLFHMGSFALALSIMIHYINHHLSNTEKPVALGLQQVFLAVSRMIAAVIGGWVLSRWDFPLLFLGWGVFLFVVLGFFIFSITIRGSTRKFSYHANHSKKSEQNMLHIASSK